MRNASVIFEVWGISYDLGAYLGAADFASDVWFDVWHATGENDGQANDAQNRALAFWNKSV